MFSKVLVANRGEIAVRIMQTCREMGIRSVAVYSEPDAQALHVRKADEAYCIGPAPAVDSYLNIPALIEAARRSGAEAVHPGYGFLAENAEFATAVLDAGLVWIGPPPNVIALLGDKVAAKELARRAGVPVVPGYDGPDLSIERLALEAERIGYPVMLKAAAGGGGKGMRTVMQADEFSQAAEGAKREALAAFADDRIFLEKRLIAPRHIEMQILLDGAGGALALGERDCSLQRRHQKVVEESPSPVMTPQLRADMSEAALRLARAAGYVNAGTVEFLFSGDNFYFLEVNTRIQVEHPVTEAVTGLDLVRLQLEIAAGERLSLTPADVASTGHAIEVRLYAENAEVGFLPATGVVDVLDLPEGPGVRNDVGVAEGAEVSRYYDPLLAKLIVSARTRGETVSRLRRALRDYTLLGTVTNLEFLRWVTAQSWFEVGKVDTGILEREWVGFPAPDNLDDAILAAVAYKLAARQDAGSPWAATGAWRQGGVGVPFHWMVGEQAVNATASRVGDDRWLIGLAGHEHVISFALSGQHGIVVHQAERVINAAIDNADGEMLVHVNGSVVRFRPVVASLGSPSSVAGNGGGPTAPMPGTVVKVAVQRGQRVEMREPLVVLEAMKMEHVIEAPHAGVVDEVLVRIGDLVPAGSPVVRLSTE